jgi:hypothetical protein
MINYRDNGPNSTKENENEREREEKKKASLCVFLQENKE